MIRVSKEHFINIMHKDAKPVLKVDAPAELLFETLDCYCGLIKPGNKIADINKQFLNPATGPVYFNNARRGDVLEIKVGKINCFSPGLSFCGVNEGLLAEESAVEELRFYEFDDKQIDFGSGIYLPLNPMIGVIGVAPDCGGVATATPGDHGGNMDTTMIKEGSKLFLPVFHDGGLLSVGDLHAAMGDGEAFYEGVEVAGEAALSVHVRHDLKIDIPFVKVDGKFASIASEKTVEASLKKAMSKLIHFIKDHSNNKGLSFTDISYIVGFYGNLEISQVVDPLMTARMSIPTSILEKLGVNL